MLFVIPVHGDDDVAYLSGTVTARNTLAKVLKIRWNDRIERKANAGDAKSI